MVGKSKKDVSCGSELNRLKPLENYDSAQFNKLYKLVKPLIRRLSYNIDHRRLNISNDLVQSYFLDKFLFIYSKYHKKYEYEQLKANILSGLKRYSYRLMRDGYTQRSEFNQSLVSFEVLFDDSKEDFDICDEEGSAQILINKLEGFMRDQLTDDEFIIWKATIDPPLFLKKLMKQSKGKLSISHLIDFFEFPRNRASYMYFSKILKKINNLHEEAKVKFS